MIRVKKIPFQKQDSEKDCAPACLKMIIEYYGGYLSMNKIRNLIKTTKNGTNAYNLIEGAKKIGFSGYGIDWNLNKKNDLVYLPAIAHVIIDNVYKHFRVVYEINWKKKTLYVADPAYGKKRMSFKEFQKITTNNWLILYPNRPIPKEKKITFLNFIIPFLKMHQILIFFLLSVFEISISISLLLFVKNFLNNNYSNLLILQLIIILILKYFLIYIKDEFLLKININYQKKFTMESFKNLLELPYKNYRSYTTGDLISRISDIQNIGQVISILYMIMTDIIIIVVISIFLIKINFILFLFTLSILMLYIFQTIYFFPKISRKIEQEKQNNSQITSYMTESITGFESIKGQNLEKNILDKFKEKYLKYQISFKSNEKIKNKIFHIRDFISDYSIIILFLLASILKSKNLLTETNFILFYTLFNSLIGPFKDLLEIGLILQNNKISIERLIFDRNNIEENISCIGDIKSDNLKIKLKDKIIMIGPSGSGKSTFLKTLKQYYQTNKIYVNQYPINKISLKENITYISQNEILFTDTLYNNITMGKNIDKNNLDRIIKICQLEQLINNNYLGMYFLIEENGFNLSGGEKQRIILARALACDKPYLFIDEGLSEVDPILERNILKDLFKYYKDKTIIFVSHRTDNIDLFKKVLKWNEKIEILEKEEQIV